MATSRWKYFFLLLAMTGILAAVTPVFFSRERQLTAAELLKAQSTWLARGPKNYSLLVRWKNQRLPNEGVRPDPVVMRLKLRFREGVLVEANENGNFVPVEQFSRWNSEGIYGKLQAWLESKTAKDYLVVDFAQTDGHPRHWVWVTRHDPDPCREEVDLVLTPLE